MDLFSSTKKAGQTKEWILRLLPGSLVSKGQPSSILSGAGHTLLDEVHPFDAVVDVWKNGVDAFDLLALVHGNHGIVGRAVDVGKCLEEGFWVTTW